MSATECRLAKIIERWRSLVQTRIDGMRNLVHHKSTFQQTKAD